MKLKGIADLPLHGGKCPRWLFPLMRELSGNISAVIVEEHGEEELLKRISDPYWFQAFGSVLGFDWHSSGLTTTTTAALKESLNKMDLGVKVGGGKGKTSRKTQDEIFELGANLSLNEKKIEEMRRSSRLSAKVDSALVQDGFNLYHHAFFFSKRQWCVVQQGMKDSGGYARRYHWLSSSVEKFTIEPHSAVVSDRLSETFNLTASEVIETQKCSLDLVRDNPKNLIREIEIIKQRAKPFGQRKLFEYDENVKSFEMTSEHFPELGDVRIDEKVLKAAFEEQPENYEQLTLIKGMGAKNIRALALISNLTHGTPLSWKDPAKYSFAHGGKDGWPYPVARDRIKANCEFLDNAVRESGASAQQKLKMLRRLGKFGNEMLKYG